MRREGWRKARPAGRPLGSTASGPGEPRPAAAVGRPAGGRFWEGPGAGRGPELPPQRVEGVGRPFAGAQAAPCGPAACVPRVPGPRAAGRQRWESWRRPPALPRAAGASRLCPLYAPYSGSRGVPEAFPALCLCQCLTYSFADASDSCGELVYILFDRLLPFCLAISM